MARSAEDGVDGSVRSEVNGVGAAAAVHDIGSGTDDEPVRTGAAPAGVRSSVIRDAVSARASEKEVGARPADEPIRARSTPQIIRTTLPQGRFGAPAGTSVARSESQSVVTATAVEHISPSQPAQDVLSGPPTQDVWAGRARLDILPSEQRGPGCRTG